MLWQLTGSYIDGARVHDNVLGIGIRNNATGQQAPEDFLVIGKSVIEKNSTGITLDGNAVVDGCTLRDNGLSAVSARTCWHQVKNNRVTGNSGDCDRELRRDVNLAACAALVAFSEAHTVFRNNIVDGNLGSGVMLVGANQQDDRARGRVDPAALNNELTNNADYGVALVNSPLYDGATTESLAARYDHALLVLAPLLDAPEETAGLIREID